MEKWLEVINKKQERGETLATVIKGLARVEEAIKD